jgi:16S rRNA (guanine966-N2)-methyltransferase
LFSILGDRCVEARVADICAGTGALGLEALSRGAQRLLSIERSPAVASVLRQNIVAVGLPGAEIMVGDARRVLTRLGRDQARFDLIFLDPPYQQRLFIPLVRAIFSEGLLAPEGLLVVEHPADMVSPLVEEGASGADEVPVVTGGRMTDQRRYGTVALAFFENE